MTSIMFRSYHSMEGKQKKKVLHRRDLSRTHMRHKSTPEKELRSLKTSLPVPVPFPSFPVMEAYKESVREEKADEIFSLSLSSSLSFAADSSATKKPLSDKLVFSPPKKSPFVDMKPPSHSSAIYKRRRALSPSPSAEGLDGERDRDREDRVIRCDGEESMEGEE